MTRTFLKESDNLLPEDRRFQKLFDNRNTDLWNYLQERYDIELEESREPGFLTYFDGDIVVIEIDLLEITPAAFTHELLHVFLKSKGLGIVRSLKEKVQEDPDLQDIFSTSLRVHIGNCLEHSKMLPLFLSRGFNREEFLRDYHKKIMDEKDMKRLEKNYYLNGKPNLGAVDEYIGKFFALKASVNPEFDYSLLLVDLKKTDLALFTILQKFWEGWLEYQIGDPQEKYLMKLDEFLCQLKKWKKISMEESN